MKVVRNLIIPFRGYVAINLFGVIFVRHRANIPPSLLRHEAIHTAQMRELLYLPFYLIYFAEWIARLIITRNARRAYIEISFEREAYAHMRQLKYLKSRRHFAQWRNISKCNT